MNKTYHFLSGFPRTGNTVLSAILNQNPNIFCSPLGPVRQYMHMLDSHSKVQEGLLRTGDYSGSDKVISNVIHNYYDGISKPIIFDRDKYWAEFDSLFLIKKFVTKHPKIIFTVRPVLEILTSFLLVYKNDPYKFVEQDMVNNDWSFNPTLSMDDNICDFLMRPNSPLDFSFRITNELINPKNKEIFHVITYNNLTANPDDVMKNIYEFIEQPYYNHDFLNVKKIEKENELAVGMPESMHLVRPTINKESHLPESVLSDYVLSKYTDFDKKIKEQLCL